MTTDSTSRLHDVATDASSKRMRTAKTAAATVVLAHLALLPAASEAGAQTIAVQQAQTVGIVQCYPAVEYDFLSPVAGATSTKQLEKRIACISAP